MVARPGCQVSPPAAVARSRVQALSVQTLAGFPPTNRPMPLSAPVKGGMRFPIFATARPSVMVVSHERSGTHFLMNAIARGYGYTVKPWVDLDYSQMPINFHAPRGLANVLGRLADQNIASIIKSHHAVEFFDPVLDDLTKKLTIFYIHRDPVSVMLSLWRFMNHWQWHEGPKRDDPLAFAVAEPEGQMLRYQMHQRRNMLDRWAAHVEGWVKAAKGRSRVRVVRYDDLKDDYAATLKSFRDLLKAKPTDLTPPPPDVDVVAKKAAVAGDVSYDRDALHALALTEVGKTMKALGYR